MSKKKVLIAAGGTGGHMFPAQALALELQEKGYEVLFAGAKLDTNKYFQKDLFSYKAVSSSTLSRGPFFRQIAVGISLFKGLVQSWKVIHQFKPDLIVGFGSFHSAPVLLAGALRKTPFILFESNAWPGRVNRFFSRFALVSAVQFSKAGSHLKGKARQVAVPFWQKKEDIISTKQEALAYFGLTSDLPTILVFGGSQGAHSINSSVVEVAKIASYEGLKIQVIHFTGSNAPFNEYAKVYKSLGIPACVKPFEEKMIYAWSASDMAICRAGAVTIAELVRFEIPSILIPFPRAAEDHQKLNALELQNLSAALCLVEGSLHKDSLFEAVKKIAEPLKLHSMKQALKEFKKVAHKESLFTIVCEFLI
ncbi:MAG: undecaprenyldiphospho-muramoylpentapeptide beta-N-acetylglucosaminyltransferase [Chlamydiae bacterium]|nr:undecaprenyldiphospho-muramoylpentapeptide beta-N-acetylglucosaminyltransferase [Chlamydiota bacterium]